jgi:hippurate hydrolase
MSNFSVTADLLAEAEALLPETVQLRRKLHRHPEVGLQLPATQAAVLEAVHGLGLEVRLGEQVTSVIGLLEGAKPGPTVLLRADMDALPMTEQTGLPFASEIEGAAHMCGHDSHTSMLVGAAKMLSARRDQLAGRVLFMWQPGEEGWHGARYMLEEGLLDPAQVGEVSHAFFIHQLPLAETGTVLLRPGPALAAFDDFRITVKGRGGHAANPHDAADPIPVAAEIVLALQTLVTRQVNVFDPAVVTVGRFKAGTTSNVIPAEAELMGTIRTLSDKARVKVREALIRTAEGIATAHGQHAEVTIREGYPVTFNDPGYTAFVEETAAGLFGAERVKQIPSPTMGAEDFSYVLQKVPGTVAMLGSRPPEIPAGEAEPLHSTRMVMDENAMTTGMALYAALALRELTA